LGAGLAVDIGVAPCNLTGSSVVHLSMMNKADNKGFDRLVGKFKCTVLGDEMKMGLDGFA
jgi:hypothetical protein